MLKKHLMLIALVASLSEGFAYGRGQYNSNNGINGCCTAPQPVCCEKKSDRPWRLFSPRPYKSKCCKPKRACKTSCRPACRPKRCCLRPRVRRAKKLCCPRIRCCRRKPTCCPTKVDCPAPACSNGGTYVTSNPEYAPAAPVVDGSYAPEAADMAPEADVTLTKPEAAPAQEAVVTEQPAAAPLDKESATVDAESAVIEGNDDGY